MKMLAEVHLTVNQLGVRGVVIPGPFYSVDLLAKSNFQNEFDKAMNIVLVYDEASIKCEPFANHIRLQAACSVSKCVASIIRKLLLSLNC